ncbi:MAG: hypothetical protein WA445_02875 [Pseudolabrys sp.]
MIVAEIGDFALTRIAGSRAIYRLDEIAISMMADRAHRSLLGYGRFL